MPLTRPRLAATALLCGLSGGAAAQTLPPPAAPLPMHVRQLDLIEGWRRPDGALVAAIVIGLEPGWHTYWRVPGMSGIPPDLDWSGSGNLAAVSYEWPRPLIFENPGDRTFGFEEALVLPVVLTPRDAAAPIDVALDLGFGVCKDICMRAEAQLVRRLDAADARPADRALIERALDARPINADEAGVTDARCGVEMGPEGPVVTAEVSFAAPPAPGLVTVIEAERRPDVWIGMTETETDGRRVRATAPLGFAGPGVMLDRGRLRVTLFDDVRAIDIRGCAGPG